MATTTTKSLIPLGLWRHVTRPVQSSFIVNNFGVKCVGEKYAKYLMNPIRSESNDLSIDKTGSRYCGITLEWGYEVRTLTISMPGYVQKC